MAWVRTPLSASTCWDQLLPEALRRLGTLALFLLFFSAQAGGQTRDKRPANLEGDEFVPVPRGVALPTRLFNSSGWNV